MKTLKKLSQYAVTAASVCASFAVLSVTQVYATTGLAGVSTSVGTLSRIVSIVSNMVVALVFIFFFISLISFLRADAETKDKSKGQLLWASLAMFVAMSIWGIIAWIGRVTGVNTREAGNAGVRIPRAVQ